MHVKGQSITIEALLIGMASLILIALALRFSSMLISPVTVVQGRIDGVLCGNVILVSNVGRQTVTVESAVAVYGNGTVSTVTSHFNPRTLQPGQTVKVVLSASPNYVTITGADFPAVTLRNECTWTPTGGGGGDGGGGGGGDSPQPILPTSREGQ